MSLIRGSTIPDNSPPAFVMCANDGCGSNAVIRLRGSNLCHAHYIAHFDGEARRYAERNSLKTVDDHRAHCRMLMNKFVSQDKRAWMKNPKSAIAARMAEELMPPVEREPGSDDEPALGIPLDELEQEFADAAQP